MSWKRHTDDNGDDDVDGDIDGDKNDIDNQW